MNARNDRPTVAVIGGTGHLGSALARRWVQAGFTVVVGSRAASRAAEAAERLASESGRPVRGLANREAAAAADIVVVTVPYATQQSVLQKGKIAYRTIYQLYIQEVRSTISEPGRVPGPDDAQGAQCVRSRNPRSLSGLRTT